MEGLKIDVVGRNYPYSECSVCHKVANKKSVVEGCELKTGTLYHIHIGSSTNFLCQNCLEKLAGILNDFSCSGNGVAQWGA